MAAPTTTAELLDLVAQSGLADGTRLRAYLDALTETQPLPPDPTRLAAGLVRDGFLTRFQAEQLLLGKWQGFRVGAYTLLERLGTDSTGMFFLCERPPIWRAVAMKVLPPASAEQPGALERFLREAQAMAACEHDNIVPVYEVNQADNLAFIAMGYVDGTNLLDLVRQGPLDPVRAACYIAQVANALQYMHEIGLVHRNVKPGNMLLERSGVIKLGGFGIVLSKRGSQYTDDAIRGTPYYIAPEQTLDSAGVDHRADIYSLGCVFYHLLTGQPPFTGGTVAQKLLWHQNRDPRPVRELRPEVPAEMVQVVDRMMSKSPDARYPSAAEIATALAPWCSTAISPLPAEVFPTHCPRVQQAIDRSSRPKPGTS